MAKEIEVGMIVEPQSRRVAEPQMTHAFRPPRREFHGDPAAETHTTEIDLFEPQRVKQIEIVERHVLDVGDLIEATAFGKPRMRRCKHFELLRPLFEEWEPDRLAQRAMQAKERRPFAGVPHLRWLAGH